MTREEALQNLIGIRDEATAYPHAVCSVTSEDEDALNMAIEALEDIERWRTWSHTYDNLISRQDAIDAIMGEPTDAHYPSWYAQRIKSLPSPEPKTGRWKLDPNGMDWNIPAWRCSECGFVANYIGVEANGLGNNPMNWAGSKFCPQCGARITGYER